MHRNQWLASVGIAGWNGSESPAALHRITHIVGASVIASWAYGLVRDTGAILLDMNPDRGLTERVRKVVETEGDRLTDLHVWRLGPGHLGAIVSVETASDRGAGFYREKLGGFSSLSHLTVEVSRAH